MPEIRSDLDTVNMTGELVTVGTNEVVALTIRNNTDVAVDAFLIEPTGYEGEGKPSVPGANTTSHFMQARDARQFRQPDGTFYAINPAEAAIAPHDETRVNVGLNNIPDGAQISLVAVAFHDGTYAGRAAQQYARIRSDEAAEFTKTGKFGDTPARPSGAAHSGDVAGDRTLTVSPRRP